MFERGSVDCNTISVPFTWANSKVIVLLLWRHGVDWDCDVIGYVDNDWVEYIIPIGSDINECNVRLGHIIEGIKNLCTSRRSKTRAGSLTKAQTSVYLISTMHGKPFLRVQNHMRDKIIGKTVMYINMDKGMKIINNSSPLYHYSQLFSNTYYYTTKRNVARVFELYHNMWKSFWWEKSSILRFKPGIKNRPKTSYRSLDRVIVYCYVVTEKRARYLASCCHLWTIKSIQAMQVDFS